MKKNLIFLAIIFMVSCNTSNPFKDAIKENITKNAMGLDVKPTFKEVTVLDTVTVNKSIEDWYQVNGDGTMSRDSLKKGVQELAGRYEELAKDDEDVRVKAKMWRFRSDRINKLSGLKKDDVDYYVVKAVYTFKNPILNADVTVSNIYLFDKDKKIMLFKDENELTPIAKQFDKSPLSKYEMLMFSDKYNIPLD